MSTPRTPPPALTWTHLLPEGATLACSSGPAWFRELIASHDNSGSSNVHVGWKLSSLSPVLGGEGPSTSLRTGRGEGPLSRWTRPGARPLTLTLSPAYRGEGTSDPNDTSAGIVLINCRGLSEDELRKAGFSYIRRFAVLPSLKNARWFVPLDSPAIAAAAFSLYTPARFSAKLKRWGAQLAARVGLPIWYRDHLLLALREPPMLEVALRPLFACDIRLALSSGAPEGARNRKASALVIDPAGRALAFGKLARSEIARRIAAHEAAILPKLGNVGAPKLLFHGQVDGTTVLAQTPLSGSPAPLQFGPLHARFLESLQTTDRLFAAETEIVNNLAARIRALPETSIDLMSAFQAVLPELSRFSVPVTIVHGDFAPWNLRVHDGRISAFDWEYAELSGLPLMDEVHYRLQVGLLLEDWSVERAAGAIATMADRHPLDLSASQTRAIAVVYLLDMLARLLQEGYDDQHEMIAWHHELLDRIMPQNVRRLPVEAATA